MKLQDVRGGGGGSPSPQWCTDGLDGPPVQGRVAVRGFGVAVWRRGSSLGHAAHSCWRGFVALRPPQRQQRGQLSADQHLARPRLQQPCRQLDFSVRVPSVTAGWWRHGCCSASWCGCARATNPAWCVGSHQPASTQLWALAAGVARRQGCNWLQRRPWLPRRRSFAQAVMLPGFN